MSYLYRCIAQRPGSVCIALILALASVQGQALELLIRDQHGQPVENAIVTVVGGSQAKAEPQLRIMDQVNRAFVPHVLLINTGDQVEFPNSDNIRHHVYSFSEPKVFEIKLYADRPKAPLSFGTPGVVVLGCNIHDTMLGYIYVSPTPHAAMSDNEGRVSVPVPDGYEGLTVWHEFYALSETEVLEMTVAEVQSSPKQDGTAQITIELLPPAPVEQAPPETGFGNSMRR